MPVPSAPQPITPGQPSAAELGVWNNRRSQARTAYAQRLAQTGLTRTQAGMARDQGAADLATAAKAGRANLPNSYLRRGMFRSGQYRAGLSNFYTQQAAQQAALQGSYGQQISQANLDEAAAANELASLLSGVDYEEAARRAELAAQIRGVM